MVENSQSPIVENLGLVNYDIGTRWMITWPLR